MLARTSTGTMPNASVNPHWRQHGLGGSGGQVHDMTSVCPLYPQRAAGRVKDYVLSFGVQRFHDDCGAGESGMAAQRHFGPRGIGNLFFLEDGESLAALRRRYQPPGIKLVSIVDPSRDRLYLQLCRDARLYAPAPTNTPPVNVWLNAKKLSSKAASAISSFGCRLLSCVPFTTLT
jgi:hypothetical protein